MYRAREREVLSSSIIHFHPGSKMLKVILKIKHRNQSQQGLSNLWVVSPGIEPKFGRSRHPTFTMAEFQQDLNL